MYATADYSNVMFVDTWATFLISDLVMGSLVKAPKNS